MLMNINIVSFSGGKDSTAMLIHLLEKNTHLDEIIFCDTGYEYPEVYKHINAVKKKYKLKITTIRPELNFKYWLGEHIKTKGKRIGSVGYGWPDFKNRWCTKELKIRPYLKYISKYKDNNISEFHGIAYDERKRVKKYPNRTIIYPLIKEKITQAEALEICYNNGFDWDGLYKKVSRTSCYLCPLSRMNEIRHLYNNYPKLWCKMKSIDKLSWRTFIKSHTLKDLENKFKKEKLK
jgi:3'-phosphoadenosine 5'-phosphosulfate sulfotransferase (PAPS reductase)/FAD synthetase